MLTFRHGKHLKMSVYTTK